MIRVSAIVAGIVGLALAGVTALGADAQAPQVISIVGVGAVADGTTLCTDAIAKAIDQLGDGGGVVQVPAGTFLTGPIRLKSNITLQVDEGATLKFATDPKLYPLVKTRYEGVEIMNYSPLIAAYGCHDVKITGKGTLDGQGSAWWKWARSSSGRKPASTQAASTQLAAPEGQGGEEGAAPAVQVTATLPGGGSGQGVGGNVGARKLMLMYTADREGKYPVEQRVFGETHPGFRPCFIEPWECKGVTIEGVTVKQSPFWNLHPVYCDGVTVRDVTVQGNGPNTDGCDPDSCSNVTIEGCHFATGDDCIAIKSGRDGDGLRVNKVCENITVRNCEMTAGHGGISIGSETSGGVRHVLGEDCTMDGPDAGIRIKAARGRGGVVEDIVCRRIEIKRATKLGVTVDLRYGSPKDTSTAEKDETTPVFRDIHLEDVTCAESPQALRVVGLPESHIVDFTMKNVTLAGKKGALMEYVDGFERENVTVTVGGGLPWLMQEVKEGK